MSRTEQILDKFRESQGWSDTTILDLALTYIENQGSPEAWEDYLTSLKETDDSFNGSAAMKCGNCGNAVTFEASSNPQVWVGSDGEITCPLSERLHGPVVPDDPEEV